MLLEKDCPIDEKFLPIFCLVSTNELPTIEVINSHAKGKNDTKEINNFLTWKQSNNELLTYNGYGYCDVIIPKKYDFLIDLDSDKGGFEINAEIAHNIWNGVLPIGTIDHGHRTIGIIEFADGIPDVLRNLKDFNDTKFILRFALCSKSDKDVIINKLKNDS